MARSKHADASGEVEQLVAINIGDYGAAGRRNAELGKEGGARAHRCSATLDDLDALWARNYSF